jgi:acetyl-CoA carboxylase carboxyl transferase subunit beta
MLKNVWGKKKTYITLPSPTSVGLAEDNLPGSTTCPGCKALISQVDMMRSHKVCPRCHYHYPLTAWERLAVTVDADTFQEIDGDLQSSNYLDFPGYTQKLKQTQQTSGLKEAVVTGQATIAGYPVITVIMDSRFMMGSMGMVVGEKVFRAVEKATLQKIPLLVFATSGGARMQEGMLSLMQMARTSAAVSSLQKAGVLYISVLTHPTTGGTIASFASLADIIIAEPGALIGFAGPRVIRQTIGQELPPNFQKSEFLLEHGMIDLICMRDELPTTIARILKMHEGEANG